MICLRHWDSVVVVREGIRTNARCVSILYSQHLPFNVIMTTPRGFFYSFGSSNSYFYLKLCFSFYFLFPEIFCWTCFPLCGGKANGGGIVCPQLPPIQCNSQTVTSSPSNSETNNPNIILQIHNRQKRGNVEDIVQEVSRGEICPCRHCRWQCKIFASSVNFSRNNAICNINESTKYILSWFHL